MVESSQVVKIAQVISGVGGARLTFRVPEDAPETCGVEFCVHIGEGDAIDRLAGLAPVPVGAPEALNGDHVRIHNCRISPCKPGAVYRATIKTPDIGTARARVVGRITPPSH